MSNSLKYWVNDPDSTKVATEAFKRIDGYYNYLFTNGVLARWRKAWLTYYGQSGEKQSYQVRASGNEGELSVFMSNEYRNLLNHLLVLVTQQRPDIQCRAANTDYDSQTQTILGNALLEYYMRQGKLERYLKQATEISLVLDTGYLLGTWDTTLGDEVAVDPETQSALRNGDIKYSALTPLDIVYDFSRRDPDSQQWYIVREYKNKFDLAAQYPEHSDDILGMGRDTMKDQIYRFDNFFQFDGINTDEIPCYTLYHIKSPGCPKGRMLQFLSPSVVLFDNPSGIPYRRLPIVRIAPSEMISRCFGYSVSNDLLGLQDVIDALISAIATNTTAFAVSSIWAPPGHNLEVKQISGGMNLIESKVKPEVLNFAQFPSELISFLNFCIERQQTLSGINSVARGNPPSGDMSGSAMALLQSMALQFQSGLQQSYVQLIEDSGQLTLNHLQDFARSPRIAMIAGKHQLFEAKSFTNQDISDIQRVFCDVGNPLSKTVSGRMTMAQDLLKNNLIHDPQQYLMVMATGRLDPLIEDSQNLLLSIRQENEALQNGQRVPVLAIENHQAHINSHYGIIATPNAKQNPNLVQNVLAHIQEHMNEWRQMDPSLAMALHLPPFPMPQPPPGMVPPGPMQPHPQGPGPQQHPPMHPPQGPSHARAIPAPLGAKVQNPQSPLQIAGDKATRAVQAPKNPLTGLPFDVQSGGLPTLGAIPKR